MIFVLYYFSFHLVHISFRYKIWNLFHWKINLDTQRKSWCENILKCDNIQILLHVNRSNLIFSKVTFYCFYTLHHLINWIRLEYFWQSLSKHKRKVKSRPLLRIQYVILFLIKSIQDKRYAPKQLFVKYKRHFDAIRLWNILW